MELEESCKIRVDPVELLSESETYIILSFASFIISCKTRHTINFSETERDTFVNNVVFYDCK